jgi:hypothetical protein
MDETLPSLATIIEDLARAQSDFCAPQMPSLRIDGKRGQPKKGAGLLANWSAT